MAGEFKMNLKGVRAAGPSQQLPIGEWKVRIGAAKQEDTEYGTMFDFPIRIVEGEHDGARGSFRLYVPDSVMEKKCNDHEKAKGNADWAGNFLGLMAGKWVALIEALDKNADRDGVDARKVAKAAEGEVIGVVVEKRKKRKPSDGDYNDINGFLKADEVSGATGEVDLADEDDSGDGTFDLDDIA